jgi:hypothetical protein
MGSIVRALFVLAVVACGSRTAAPLPAPPPPVVPLSPAPLTSSPGPLIAGHAGLDERQACDACHVNNTVAIDNKNCLACHDPVEIRMRRRKGFHSSRAVRGKPCSTCHADHRGRGFDPMGWSALPGGRAGFDHAQTGWPLDGAHATRACGDCHKSRDDQGFEMFIHVERECEGCHEQRPHAFGKDELLACGRCHSTRAWQPPLPELAFNHDDSKDARMPLLGAHATVACRACHPDAVFNLRLASPNRCETCHASPHAGTINSTQPCEQCHHPASFKRITFDHTSRTRFDLGAHKHLACTTCHTPALGAKKPAAGCEMCHAAISPHGTRFAVFGKPARCGVCHTPTPSPRWRPNGFDHGKQTKFPLVAKHAELTCRACHRGKGPTDFEKLDASKGCLGCHAHVNVHDKKYANSECLKCHTPAGAIH